MSVTQPRNVDHEKSPIPTNEISSDRVIIQPFKLVHSVLHGWSGVEGWIALIERKPEPHVVGFLCKSRPQIRSPVRADAAHSVTLYHFSYRWLLQLLLC